MVSRYPSSSNRSKNSELKSKTPKTVDNLPKSIEFLVPRAFEESAEARAKSRVIIDYEKSLVHSFQTIVASSSR